MRNAVFLDRDGVLTQIVWDESLQQHTAPLCGDLVQLEDGAAEAILLLQEKGWTVCVVSNQPEAARGHCTLDDLSEAHRVFEGLLAEQGARVDAWRYCYHDPNGVDPKLSVKCACRKPMPGMLFDLAMNLGIRLEKSWMVGDSDKDIEAGKFALCKTALVLNPSSWERRRIQNASEPDILAADVLEAAQKIASP